MKTLTIIIIVSIIMTIITIVIQELFLIIYISNAGLVQTNKARFLNSFSRPEKLD